MQHLTYFDWLKQTELSSTFNLEDGLYANVYIHPSETCKMFLAVYEDRTVCFLDVEIKLDNLVQLSMLEWHSFSTISGYNPYDENMLYPIISVDNKDGDALEKAYELGFDLANTNNRYMDWVVLRDALGYIVRDKPNMIHISFTSGLYNTSLREGDCVNLEWELSPYRYASTQDFRDFSVGAKQYFDKPEKGTAIYRYFFYEDHDPESF